MNEQEQAADSIQPWLLVVVVDLEQAAAGLRGSPPACLLTKLILTNHVTQCRSSFYNQTMSVLCPILCEVFRTLWSNVNVKSNCEKHLCTCPTSPISTNPNPFKKHSSLFVQLRLVEKPHVVFLKEKAKTEKRKGIYCT